MDFSLIDFNVIRRLSRETIGVPASKYSKPLFIEISLVLLGVKSAYLLDLFSTDVDKLAAVVYSFQEYLKNCFSRKSVGNCCNKPGQTYAKGGSLEVVRILEIGLDLVVVADSHLSMISQIMAINSHSTSSPTRDASKETVFVDASADRKSPTLLDDEIKLKITAWIFETMTDATDIGMSTEMNDIMPSNSTEALFQFSNESNLVRVQRLTLSDFKNGRVIHSNANDGNNNPGKDGVKDSACVPSLFGVLLGYPVVYFVSGAGENCLGFVPLKLISVVCQVRNDFEHRCLSFSVPEHLYSDVILTALNPLETRLKDVFDSVRVEVENIVQPYISL